MNKEMSRKEFLQHVALMMLAAVGVSGFISSISSLSDRGAGSGGGSSYGARPYGR